MPTFGENKYSPLPNGDGGGGGGRGSIADFFLYKNFIPPVIILPYNYGGESNGISMKQFFYIVAIFI